MSPGNVRRMALQGSILGNPVKRKEDPGILTGTTQQVFFLERLHMVGMTEQDIVSVRIAFADMPGFPRGTHAATECIAKPEWWKRRPGGGEGA